MKPAGAVLICLLAASVPRTFGGAGNDQSDDGGSTAPEFRWAQRKDRILLTIDLQGVTAEKFEVSNEGKFRFAGRGAYRDARENVRDFALEVDLLKPLNASDPSCGGLCDNWRLHPRSKTCKLPEGAQDRPWEKCTLGSESYNVTHCEVTARDVQCVLIKKTREPYWGHLLKDNERPSYMHVDWSRWLDEDKDGVRWNEQIDRAWEWWKHDDAEDEDEENEEQRAAREQQEQKQRERYKRGRKKAKRKA